jgi:hypothetical protein
MLCRLAGDVLRPGESPGTFIALSTENMIGSYHPKADPDSSARPARSQCGIASEKNRGGNSTRLQN